MGRVDKIRKWLRGAFPGLYGRFGRYFHTHYPSQRRILKHVRLHPEQYSDPELAAAVDRLSKGAISVFSFPGCERYDTLAVEVHVDGEGFPWVDHGGRRLWFRQGSDPASVVATYRRLLQEQDPASPHCYRAGGCEVRDGDVLLDVGSAEGIFALDNVERAGRVVLFEVDPAWIGALERTFEPWRDKVDIVNKFASDADDDGNTTIDSVVGTLSGEGALFLKLDVEGAEERVLSGAERALSRPDTRAVVCTYHRQDDHRRLSEVMRGCGFKVATSPGRMLFILDPDLSPPFFRRGVIYCTK
jgi:hypothetical protein